MLNVSPQRKLVHIKVGDLIYRDSMEDGVVVLVSIIRSSVLVSLSILFLYPSMEAHFT